MTRLNPPTRYRRALLLILLLTGCSADERYVRLGEQSCQRQAEQNKVIANQTEQATQMSADFLAAEAKKTEETTRLRRELADAQAKSLAELLQLQQDLVKRDAETRQDLLALQGQVQEYATAERKASDARRDEIEKELRDVAQQRQQAPIIAAAITEIGLIFACLLPLVLCGYLLRVLNRSGSSDAELSVLIVKQVSAGHLLLGQPGLPALRPPDAASVNRLGSP